MCEGVYCYMMVLLGVVMVTGTSIDLLNRHQQTVVQEGFQVSCPQRSAMKYVWVMSMHH